MKAKLVVFPIRGRSWCFSRSIDQATSQSASVNVPSTVTDLWKKISSDSKPINANAELLVDFISNKMNSAWMGLENAPEGTLKNKIHGLGLRLLARVKPSEIFLKSISKEVTNVQVTYPSSLNARLVRRRLRHTAMRGAIIHRKYLYGSVSLLPLTSALTVLPLPNVPFFWVLFRTYSHWRALQGSEKLVQLLSHELQAQNSKTSNGNESVNQHDDSEHGINNSQVSICVLQPSKELEKLTRHGAENGGLSECAISKICKTFHLNKIEVLKYRDSL